MLRRAATDLFKHWVEFFVVHETHNCSLGIAPRQVAEQLVNRLVESFDALPKLAFGDKNIRAFVADEDVRFALLNDFSPIEFG
jgi:hypothetical protein